MLPRTRPRYCFEDFHVGDKHRFSAREVTRDAIIEFARTFDPLPFHLSEETAARTHYGTLIASGLHTLCLTAALVVEGILRDSSMAGSSGMQNVTWRRPVLPGDQLSVIVTILETEPWAGAKKLGRVRMDLDTVNQSEQTVMKAVVDYLFELR